VRFKYKYCPGCKKMAEFPKHKISRGRTEWRCFDCKLAGNIAKPPPSRPERRNEMKWILLAAVLLSGCAHRLYHNMYMSREGIVYEADEPKKCVVNPYFGLCTGSPR
jgi:hypothetical protein